MKIIKYKTINNNNNNKNMFNIKLLLITIR